MVKFIHTADWHLGMQAHFLPEEARSRFAEDRFGAVRQIAELARDEDCAFVVVAGDVFDSNHVAREVVAKAIDALALFTVPVFLLPGNHDALDGSSVYLTADWCERKPANIVVIDDTTARQPVGMEGVEVIGSPWNSRHRLGDPVAPCYGVASLSSGALRIIVGHGVVDELTPNADDPSLVSATGMREALASGGAHYIALGDRHSVTEISATDGRAYYSGTPVSTNYGETDPNEVLLVELEDDKCTVRPFSVGTWEFDRPERDLASEEDVAALERWLDDVPTKHTAVVKLALRGTLTLAASATLEDVLERSRMTFASLNTWERQTDLVVVPDDADLATLDVSGYVRETLEGLREEAAASGEHAAVARDALNLLYRLAR